MVDGVRTRSTERTNSRYFEVGLTSFKNRWGGRFLVTAPTQLGNDMPEVEGKHYAYTKKGKEAAKRARKRLRKKKK